jgi:MoaA/NifB/PqqE/SkfB family radical SAM enzyme
MVKDDLTHEETRAAVDLIIDRTKALHDRGKPKEVLTVDNHADGPYLYMRLLKEDPGAGQRGAGTAQMNEGNNSGRGIGCVSWDGKFTPTSSGATTASAMFARRPFSEIWTHAGRPLLLQLKDKKQYVQGRCAGCTWLMSAAVISGCGRKRFPAMYGRRIRPAT